jgi:hypothetical protein
MGKEMLGEELHLLQEMDLPKKKKKSKERHQGKEKRLFTPRKGRLSNLMEERQRETCARTRK